MVLGRIDADRDDAELVAGAPVELLEPRHQRVELQGADRLAGEVVHRDQDGRLAVQVLAQRDRVAVVVGEGQVVVHRLAKVLVHTDRIQSGRKPLLRVGGGQQGDEQQRHQ